MGRRTALRQQQDHVPRTSHDVVAGLCASAGVAIAKGDWAKAGALYARVVAMGVVDANVYNNLATLYDRQGTNQNEAFEFLCQAHALAPEDQNIKKNLLCALTRTIVALAGERRFREALPLFEQKAAMEPQSALAQRELGYCHAQLGDLQTAIQYFTRAINLDPNEANYYNDLGLACYDLRMLSEAKGAFQQVLNLRPDSIVAYVHLGLLANLTGLPAIAVNMLRRAIEIDPTCGEAHNNLALFLRDQGRQEECRKHYVEAVRLKPDSLEIFSSYLLSLNDDPHADPAWVAAEHRRFQLAVKGGVRPIVARDLEPTRRLRIAYLSPDLRRHSVAYFLLPLLEAHDRSKVEVTCYSTSNLDDDVTERIRAACDRWRSVYRASDEELAEMIGRDEIDILVELSGHTAENRLPMLARRVTPIQMTYLGYPNTTGLAEMDYRITDAIADPPGASDAWHTERLIRVEGGFLAFRPLEGGGNCTPGDQAAEESRAVTFGSFNNLAKINAVVLDAWASILQGVPGSKLFLKAKGLRDERIQERIRAVFRARGVDAEARVTMVGHERSNAEHLRLYHRVDLALDTFPYNGTTTTCEALWMGTPVVTYEGRSHAGRVGASLLTDVGLGELVAKDLQGYINKAVSLGRDWEALVRLRSGLRERFATSPVMDANRLARGLETAYRNAWHRFCAGSR
jgi:predicted O-linked N-acetylglucosamine transferase (SPINDLY family)